MPNFTIINQNESPLLGEKCQNLHLSKFNTGVAAAAGGNDFCHVICCKKASLIYMFCLSVSKQLNLSSDIKHHPSNGNILTGSPLMGTLTTRPYENVVFSTNTYLRYNLNIHVVTVEQYNRK